MPNRVFVRKRIPIEDRFWSKVTKKSGCWEWSGTLNSKGYPLIGLPGRNNGSVLAHRLSYEIKYGKIPKGMCALHKCDNPVCTKPTHLFLGTQYDNIKDMVEKGRNRGAIGIRNANSKLTDVDVINIRNIYKVGSISYEEIGKKFKVSKVLIGMVVRKKIWSHI